MASLLPPSAMLQLPPGKHPDLELELSGRARAVRRVTPRLLFFELLDASGELVECLAKERDGFLAAADLAALGAALDGAPLVRLRAFPESHAAASPAVVAHLKRIEASDGAWAFPAAAAGARAEAAPRYVGREAWKRSGNRVRPNNESRHQQFVHFLVETFGEAALRRGAGVLDVAGGAGGVAFELAFRWGIPCTVVDPRPLKCTSKQRRAFCTRARASGATPPHAPPPPPPHEEGGVAAAFTHAAICEGLAPAELCLPRQLCCLFGERFPYEQPRLWRDCSLVVGMHPDQAAEPIVDLALQYGKHFATVPCCVFPSQFPQRRTMAGEPVSTYEQFCSYLLEKDPSPQGVPARLACVKLSALEGRSTVIFSVPESSAPEQLEQEEVHASGTTGSQMSFKQSVCEDAQGQATDACGDAVPDDLAHVGGQLEQLS
ncbi:hypothetical protein AB1Y20_007812 [Prymnesium parvum]|uniref:Uncharacterized protein n=1 Tax=Prymnesium parvum TaxID=97485 RepID=A0AB34IUV6_PRYPA